MMEEITYDEAKVMYDQGNIVLNEYIFNDISTLISDTDIMRHLETVANINKGTIWVTDIYGRIIFPPKHSRQEWRQLFRQSIAIFLWMMRTLSMPRLVI